MSSVRRTGRVPRIACDETPLSAPHPDIDARIGWLLAMSRLHHRDGSLSAGRHWAEALSGAGHPASQSLVARWESGDAPAPYEAMSAYETALGLEPGRISSLTGYIRAAMPGVQARVIRPQLDPGSPEFGRRLDTLIELAEDGHATAQDWQELGWCLAAAPLVHLRASTWATLAGRTVSLLSRSVGVPYRALSTAGMNLASVPRAREFLVAAIDHHLAVPHVQVFLKPLVLLDHLPTPRASRLVLDLVERPPNDGVFALAVWLAGRKAARGEFTAEERTRLEMTVLRMWRSNPVRAGDDLAELIASLPEGLRSTLTRAATRAGRLRLGYVVEHGEEMGTDRVEAMSRAMAEAVRSRVPQEPAYDEDPMLARLFREGLFHRDSERRHLASLMLSASPFGDGATDELLLLLTRPGAPRWLRARAATLVRYLGQNQHRMRMMARVDDPDETVAVLMTQGVGHLAFSSLSDQALRASLGDRQDARSTARLLALGLTGSPGLAALARSNVAPRWQRDAAGWWIEHGSAVRC